jgi:hypothetical protein
LQASLSRLARIPRRTLLIAGGGIALLLVLFLSLALAGRGGAAAKPATTPVAASPTDTPETTPAPKQPTRPSAPLALPASTQSQGSERGVQRPGAARGDADLTGAAELLISGRYAAALQAYRAQARRDPRPEYFDLISILEQKVDD